MSGQQVPTLDQRVTVADVLAEELRAISTAKMGLFNAVEQDDHIDSWEETLYAAGDLEDAVEALRERIRLEAAKREEGDCDG